MTSTSNDRPPGPDKAREEDHLSGWTSHGVRRARVDLDELLRTDALLDELRTGALVQVVDDPAVNLLAALAADVQLTTVGDDVEHVIATLLRLAAHDDSSFHDLAAYAGSDLFTKSRMFDAKRARPRRRLAAVAASMLVTSGIGVAAASPGGPISTGLQTAISSVLGTGPSAEEAATAALARAEAAMARGDYAAAGAALIEAAEAATDVGGQQAADLWSQIEDAENRLNVATDGRGADLLSVDGTVTLGAETLVEGETSTSNSSFAGGPTHDSIVVPGLSAPGKSGSAGSRSARTDPVADSGTDTDFGTDADSGTEADANEGADVDAGSDDQDDSHGDKANEPVKKSVKVVVPPPVDDIVSSTPAKPKAVDPAPTQGSQGNKADSAASSPVKPNKQTVPDVGSNQDVTSNAVGGRPARAGKPTALPDTAAAAAVARVTP